MRRVAVLGSTGWLGSAVVERVLRDQENEVLMLDRRMLEGVGPERLGELLAPDADLSVINCVGVIRGTDSAIIEANLSFVENLVKALTPTSAHLVQIGSAAEYGDPASSLPISEDHRCAPLTLYGRTKLQATALAMTRPDWTVVRPFNGVDANMTAINPLREIREKVRTAQATSGGVELWSAQTVRDHVSRTFLAESLHLAAENRPAGIYNLCSGVGLSYRELTEAMMEVAGGRLPIRDLRQESGIASVVGDPARWTKASGLAEALSASEVAALVMAG